MTPVELTYDRDVVSDIAITIELPSGERMSVSKDIAVVGSDERCDVRLAGLEPRHAQIRKVASRWLAESLGTWTLEVRDGDASRMAWLRPEDVISLTPGGLRIIFEPKTALETTKTPVVEPRRRKEPPPLPKANDYEHAQSSEDRLDNGLSSNDVRKKPRTTPPPLPSERKQGKTLSSPEPSPQPTHPVTNRPKATPPPLPTGIGSIADSSGRHSPPPNSNKQAKSAKSHLFGDESEHDKAPKHTPAFVHQRSKQISEAIMDWPTFDPRAFNPPAWISNRLSLQELAYCLSLFVCAGILIQFVLFHDVTPFSSPYFWYWGLACLVLPPLVHGPSNSSLPKLMLMSILRTIVFLIAGIFGGIFVAAFLTLLKIVDFDEALPWMFVLMSLPTVVIPNRLEVLSVATLVSLFAATRMTHDRSAGLCARCRGTGYCVPCQGRGLIEGQRCSHCLANGMCSDCAGTGGRSVL